MRRALFEVFRFLIVFVVVFVNCVVGTVKESVRYILIGEHFGPKITFIVLYAMYCLAFFYIKPLFIALSIIWMYCEVYVSCRAVSDIYNGRKDK